MLKPHFSLSLKAKALHCHFYIRPNVDRRANMPPVPHLQRQYRSLTTSERDYRRFEDVSEHVFETWFLFDRSKSESYIRDDVMLLNFIPSTH